jgi:hypothetical protein
MSKHVMPSLPTLRCIACPPRALSGCLGARPLPPEPPALRAVRLPAVPIIAVPAAFLSLVRPDNCVVADVETWPWVSDEAAAEAARGMASAPNLQKGQVQFWYWWLQLFRARFAGLCALLLREIVQGSYCLTLEGTRCCRLRAAVAASIRNRPARVQCDETHAKTEGIK